MILDVSDPGFDARVCFAEYIGAYAVDFTSVVKFTECSLNYWLLDNGCQSSPFDDRGKLLIRVWELYGFVRVCGGYGVDQLYCEVL